MTEDLPLKTADSLEGDGSPDPGRRKLLAAATGIRSVKPEYLVLVPICTHLGCVRTFRPDVAPADLGPEWPGGYFCPCHGSKFDFAGRVYRNVPAPTNLVVPPHRYLAATTVTIGEDPDKST